MLDVSAVGWCSTFPTCRSDRSVARRRGRELVVRWPEPAWPRARTVMVDVHPRPEMALCDGAQALTRLLDELAEAVATIPADASTDVSRHFAS